MRTALLAFAVLPFTLVVVGCDNNKDMTTDAGPTASSTAASMVADAAPLASASGSGKPMNKNHHGGLGGGATTLLFRAADDADLKPEQDAKVDALMDEGHDGMGAGHATMDGGAVKSAMKSMHDELVTEVKAGKIETAKLEPQYIAFEKQSQERLDKEADSLNKLYAILEPAQRKALVADARTKLAKRDQMMAKHERPDGGMNDERKNHVAMMTKNLGLDADQQKKLDALVTKDAPKATDTMMADMKKRNEAVLDAFEKDTFDAKKLDAYKADKKARAPMEKETALLSQLLTILKPEQREKLAKQMDSQMMHGGMGRGGMGHGGMDHGGPGSDPHMTPMEDVEENY